MDALIPVPLSQPHWETVSEALRRILTVVGAQPFAGRFCLAGGTALALQLGHRVSVDLDFFSAGDELLDASRQEIITALRPHLTFEIVQDVVGSMLLNVEGVALGFFSYQYPLLAPPLLVEQVQVAGLLDIGLMKLDAIASRGVKKDFYDLYFIAHHLPLDTLLDRAPDKYAGMRDFGMMALEALVDFSVAEQQPALTTTPLVTWAEVQAFCQAEVQRIGGDWFEQG